MFVYRTLHRVFFFGLFKFCPRGGSYDILLSSAMGEADAPVMLSAAENMALGVAAGTIEVSMLQPMLYCKNASQQGLPFTLNPAVLYRGLSMSVLNMSILTGVQFPITGMCQGLVTGGQKRKLSSPEQITAAFMGGAASGIVCAPMELIMIQQQVIPIVSVYTIVSELVLIVAYSIPPPYLNTPTLPLYHQHVTKHVANMSPTST
mgnify:CR=1 FL=1